jgi:hypothetical protein
MISRHTSLLLALVALSIVVTSCGGGGGASTPPPPPPPALTITTTVLPNVIQGQPYNQTLQASGGTAPYSWSAVAGLGSFPRGMTLSTAGVLSGIAEQGGGCLLVLQVRDSGSPAQTVTGNVTFNVGAILSITSDGSIGNSNINIGNNITERLFANGGTGPFRWSLQSGSGALPQGWSVATDDYSGNGFIGRLGGTVTVSGNYTFTVQVNDLGSPAQVATKTYSVSITNNLVMTADENKLVAVVHRPFRITLTALGGTPPYHWAFNGTPGPGLSWLTLDPLTGEIAGTPPLATSYGVALILTDSSPNGQPVSGNINIRVQPQLYFTLPVRDFIVGKALESGFDTLPVEGGIRPYTVQVISGSLPPGLALPTGPVDPSLSIYFTGTPTTAGTFHATLQVTDSETPPAGIQQDFALRVSERLSFQSPGNFPNAVEGQPYSFSFNATGGLLPLAWSVYFPPPPPNGLSIDQTGNFGGTPTTAYLATVVIGVADSSNPTQSASVNKLLQVLGKLRVTTTSLPNLSPDSSVRLQIGVSGGIGQYTWTQTGGTLPSGLVLDAATGTISGQTAQTGSFSPILRVTDSGPPAQVSDPVTLQFSVAPNLGRNDSPATATPLSNGTYLASLSPLADPPTGVANPDSDYYKITATPGATVAIEITAQRLTPPSPLDSVLEFVDAPGTRLTLCSPSPTGIRGPFTQPCVHDDLQPGVRTDSKLILQVPSGNSVPLTFYAHVLDFRGDARPDFLYTITVSGANGSAP